MPRQIFTIGHSTRTWDDFVAILKSHNIQALADVRRFPGSRRHPHFNAGAMKDALPRDAIQYLPMPALGGRRPAQPDSPNTAWRNASFRGYADYMRTPEFLSALDSLQSIASEKPTAFMCAEALPWQCHRSLIADALLIRGWEVLDIYDARQIKPHTLTKFAKVRGTEITYPADDPGLFINITPVRDG